MVLKTNQGTHQNEFIFPAIIDIEKAKAGRLFGLTSCSTLVDSFNNLKGQVHARHLFKCAIIIVFAWPDELSLCDLYFCHIKVPFSVIIVQSPVQRRHASRDQK